MLKEQIFKSVSDDMSKATARFSPSEIDGISEKETSKGNISVVKKYNLTTIIGDRATLTLTDPELIKSVEKIKFAEVEFVFRDAMESDTISIHQKKRGKV